MVDPSRVVSTDFKLVCQFTWPENSPLSILHLEFENGRLSGGGGVNSWMGDWVDELREGVSEEVYW